LEELHLAMKNSEEINGALIRKIVERCWIPMGRDDDVKKRRLERDLLNYYHDSRDHTDEVISVEEPFSIPDDDIIIEGRTDLIIRTRDGGLELVDFKAREHGGVERMALEYQLRTYEYALRERYRFDSLSAYAIKDSMRISFDSDPEFRVKERIAETVARIRDECFEPRKNPFCSRCVFRTFCGVGD
ncbi:MAG TPA: PD-(D/E)XK nuclease family protein, partial [Methanothermobacter thermautotrophicus]|nr:PD-(D/E)XK nuclease family protein [Methanothermobacter thermautotrophicus]